MLRKSGRVTSRLSELAEQRGINLTQLSKEIGVAQSTLSQIASGEREGSFGVLVALCDYFQCEISDLVSIEPLVAA